MPSPNEIRDAITQKIVEAMKNGTRPWVKPWTNIPDPVRFPTNIVSGRAYRGINNLLLTLEANEKNYPVGYWATYRQWQALGQQVRRGERSTQVMYYRQVPTTRTNEKGEREEGTWPLLRTWNVFNLSATDGPLADKHLTPPTTPPVDNSDHGDFFRVIEATGAKIEFGGNRAAYFRSPLDLIRMPAREQFDSFEAFAETLSHELAHWTGAEHRLNRRDSYEFEELTAEIAAAFVLQSTGVRHPDIMNSASYLTSWVRQIEDGGPSVIFQAASLASDATDYILDFSRSDEASDSELITEAV